MLVQILDNDHLVLPAAPMSAVPRCTVPGA